MKNDYQLKVNVSSFKNVVKELDEINTEMIGNLSAIKKEYNNNLDDILNTPAAKDYKGRTIEYLDNTIESIYKENTYLIDKLKYAINAYEDLYNDLSLIGRSKNK